jgi:alpha 1,6-mannosyltransferase
MLSAVLRILPSTAQAVEWTHHHALHLQQYKDQGKAGSEAYKELNGVNVLDKPSMGGAIGVMDWTGPGLFTDAVMRWVLLQYLAKQSRTQLTCPATSM